MSNFIKICITAQFNLFVKYCHVTQVNVDVWVLCAWWRHMFKSGRIDNESFDMQVTKEIRENWWMCLWILQVRALIFLSLHGERNTVYFQGQKNTVNTPDRKIFHTCYKHRIIIQLGNVTFNNATCLYKQFFKFPAVRSISLVRESVLFEEIAPDRP